MLIRFVLGKKHPDTGRARGVFDGAYDLRESDSISPDERLRLDDLLVWFETELSTPDRFNRTKSKGYYRRSAKGIAWFKDSAHAHLRKAREIASILEDCGTTVSMIKTDNPGYVVYEDDIQVIAEPYKDTLA